MSIEDRTCAHCKQPTNSFIAVDEKVVNGNLEFKAVCKSCFKWYYNNGDKVP